MADPYGNAQAGGLGGAKAPQYQDPRTQVAWGVNDPINNYYRQRGQQYAAHQQQGQNAWNAGYAGFDFTSMSDEDAQALVSALGISAPPGVPLSGKNLLMAAMKNSPETVGRMLQDKVGPRQGESPEMYRDRMNKMFPNSPNMASKFGGQLGKTQDEIAADQRESEKAAYDKGMAGLRDQYSSLYGQYQKAAAPYFDINSPEAQAQRQMVSQQVMHGVDRQAMSRGLGGAGYSMNVQGQANTLAQNQLADQRAQMGANILGQGMNALSGLGNAIQQPYQTGLGAQQWDRQFGFQQDQAKRQEALQRAQMQANQTASIIGGVGSVVGGLGSLIPGVGPAVSGLASGLSRGIGGAAGGASLANYQGPAGRNF